MNTSANRNSRNSRKEFLFKEEFSSVLSIINRILSLYSYALNASSSEGVNNNKKSTNELFNKGKTYNYYNPSPFVTIGTFTEEVSIILEHFILKYIVNNNSLKETTTTTTNNNNSNLIASEFIDYTSELECFEHDLYEKSFDNLEENKHGLFHPLANTKQAPTNWYVISFYLFFLFLFFLFLCLSFFFFNVFILFSFFQHRWVFICSLRLRR
jgi:hypothetical protein